jgi:hypothetical protein
MSSYILLYAGVKNPLVELRIIACQRNRTLILCRNKIPSDTDLDTLLKQYDVKGRDLRTD